MEREKGILQLADYYEKFEVGDSSAYLIINENMRCSALQSLMIKRMNGRNFFT